MDEPSDTQGNGYDVWSRNLAALTEISGQAMTEATRLISESASDSSSLSDMAKLWGDVCGRMWQRPDLWVKYYHEAWQQTASVMSGKTDGSLHSDPTRDKRFADEGWTQDVFFSAMKDMYFRSCGQAESWVSELADGDPVLKQQYEFYVRQYLDALSPSNFALTNPAVMRTFVETKGESLLKGMRALVEDLQQSKGFLSIKQTPEHAFKIGENIAMTNGDVIFKNYLTEIIRFRPKNDNAYGVPLILIPAWINKYYILDLSPEKSLVKWLTAQGYDVYVLSWINPGEDLKHISFEDYLKDGALAALDAVREYTGSDKVSMAGYCLGGTLLACLLSHLEQHGRAKEVVSATFLTTLLDFSDSGDLNVFIDKDRINALEKSMETSGGVLEGRVMANIFSLIRANDLIWNMFVNRYLLGKDPMPFDILFWNADSTNLPAAMHIYYLRNMYADNKLIQPGALTMANTPIDLRHISIPCYFLATKEDHIAPWKAVYEGSKHMQKAARMFVLAGSGHVAGVINPPSKQKYGYRTADAHALMQPASEWLESAQEHTGSWWSHWDTWQRDFVGDKIPLTKPKTKPLYPAPGAYALQHYSDVFHSKKPV